MFIFIRTVAAGALYGTVKHETARLYAQKRNNPQYNTQ